MNRLTVVSGQWPVVSKNIGEKFGLTSVMQPGNEKLLWDFKTDLCAKIFFMKPHLV